MLKKCLLLSVIGLLLNFVCYAPVAASTKLEEETKFTAKVKREIAKLGTGAEARVEVKLHDNTKLKGFVSDISEEHFTVTDARTGVATVVPYPQVKKVKGNNLSTGAKIAIGIGIFVGLLLVVTLIIANNDKR
jgi:hypothetical protein